MNQSMNKEILEISIEDIIPNRFQPRLTFDMTALNELANSIKEHGIIQPLVVRRLQDKFEIIAGERRYKAATLIGMKKVPCIVMDLNDNESAEVAVIENIQRKEMTPLEEAKSFKKILDKGYLTQEELAKRMGKSQSTIANKLRLLNLDEVVQDAILEGKISERHARSLLKIDDKIEQRNVLTEIINNRLTVRQTDDLIKEKYGKGPEVGNMDNNSMFNNMNPNNYNNNQNISSTQTPPIQNSIFKSPEPRVEEKQVNNNMNETHQYMSTPTVNIPINNITNDVNPQLNLMHNLGIIDNTKKEEEPKQEKIEPSSSLDIFKMDNSSSPSIQSLNEQDIQKVITPSVLSDDSSSMNVSNTNNSNNNANNNMIFQDIQPFNNTPNYIENTNNNNNNNNYMNNMSNMNNNDFVTNTFNSNDNSMFNSSLNNQYQDINQVETTNMYGPSNNGMMVDINEIKNNAQDIIQKEEKEKDLSTLLSTNNKPENKFFVDLNMPTDLNIDPLESQPFKVKKTVTELNKKLDELKLQGINIIKEETDLGNTYQIVIRIDK